MRFHLRKVSQFNSRVQHTHLLENKFCHQRRHKMALLVPPPSIIASPCLDHHHHGRAGALSAGLCCCRVVVGVLDDMENFLMESEETREKVGRSRRDDAGTGRTLGTHAFGLEHGEDTIFHAYAHLSHEFLSGRLISGTFRSVRGF